MEKSNQFRLNEQNVGRLTNWANEPTLYALKNDLQSAKAGHDVWLAKLTKWDELTKVEGKAAPKKVKGRSNVQPKLIRRQAEWRYSALTEPFNSSNKLFKVSPTTFEDAKAAAQNELILNYQFRTKLNRVKFVDDLVRGVVDEGTGLVRVSWTRHTKKIKKTVPIWEHYDPQTEEEMAQLEEAFSQYQENPRGFLDSASPELKASISLYEDEGVIAISRQVGEKAEMVEVPIINQPYLEITNPRNFFIDPTCNGDINKAMYAVVSFETTKADLMKEPNRYKNLDHVSWDTLSLSNQYTHATNSSDSRQVQDALRKRVVAYEYWGFADIYGTGELVPIVATWIGDTLIRLEENPYPDGKIPFVVIPYLPVKRDLFGEPDAELLEDNQAIMGALMRGMIDLLGRSANSQMGIAKGMLDPVNRRRFENGEDYEFNPSQNPAQGTIEHKYPELPQSALTMLGLQNQEAEALTGVKSFSGGISGEAYGDVAAGIRGALDAASKREMAILRRVAQGIKEIGAKIISMNSIFLSKEEIVRVTNEQFIKVNREDLKGSFDLEVDIATAEVDNQKAQDLAFMLQTIGNNMDIGITLFILSEICKLKRMPELAHKLLNFKKEPSEHEQKMAELQIAEMEAKVQLLQSEIALNQAKAESEMHKAESTQLNNVEQEMGVKHNRDMARIQGQARANQDYQITKALTEPTKDGQTKPGIEAAVGWNVLSDKMDSSNVAG